MWDYDTSNFPYTIKREKLFPFVIITHKKIIKTWKQHAKRQFIIKIACTKPYILSDFSLFKRKIAIITDEIMTEHLSNEIEHLIV